MSEELPAMERPGPSQGAIEKILRENGLSIAMFLLFWQQSFQNWQSEFSSITVIVLLSIVLRERGSSQSKPVAAPHSQTGE